MEKHKCKLCLRSFANGRALGGHMRSHMMNLHVPPKIKQQQYQEEEEQEKNDHQLSEEMESLAPSSSSASSSSEEEEEVEEGEIGNRGLMSKGLRKKQRKRCSLVDPEFSFAVEATGSVVLQDGESETESSKKSICRRSKRIRKSRISDTRGFSGYYLTEEEPHVDKSKPGKEGKSPTQSPSVEHEPVSSISDTTPEEDVAYCLMMLSRDKWNEERYEYEVEEEEESEEGEDDEKETKKDAKDHCHDSGAIKVTKSRYRGKYRCETCKKVFRSYQALGGHRASHKRIKVNNKSSAEESAMVVGSGNAGASCTVVEEKIHECPVCYRVFPSGQALGGHKRSHVIGVSSTNISIPSKPYSRFGETLIDLNLPAPMDDEDIISQVELSAVSDAEFVNPISQ